MNSPPIRCDSISPSPPSCLLMIFVDWPSRVPHWKTPPLIPSAKNSSKWRRLSETQNSEFTWNIQLIFPIKSCLRGPAIDCIRRQFALANFRRGSVDETGTHCELNDRDTLTHPINLASLSENDAQLIQSHTS